MLSFKQWLKEDAGLVDSGSITNTSSDDAFSKIASKYAAGQKKDREKSFDPDKQFAMKIKMMKKKMKKGDK